MSAATTTKPVFYHPSKKVQHDEFVNDVSAAMHNCIPRPIVEWICFLEERIVSSIILKDTDDVTANKRLAALLCGQEDFTEWPNMEERLEPFLPRLIYLACCSWNNPAVRYILASCDPETLTKHRYIEFLVAEYRSGDRIRAIDLMGYQMPPEASMQALQLGFVRDFAVWYQEPDNSYRWLQYSEILCGLFVGAALHKSTELPRLEHLFNVVLLRCMNDPSSLSERLDIAIGYVDIDQWDGVFVAMAKVPGLISNFFLGYHFQFSMGNFNSIWKLIKIVNTSGSVWNDYDRVCLSIRRDKLFNLWLATIEDSLSELRECIDSFLQQSDYIFADPSPEKDTPLDVLNCLEVRLSTILPPIALNHIYQFLFIKRVKT